MTLEALADWPWIDCIADLESFGGRDVDSPSLKSVWGGDTACDGRGRHKSVLCGSVPGDLLARPAPGCAEFGTNPLTVC